MITRYLPRLAALLLAIAVLFCPFSSPAEAATSSAVRAFDDNKVSTKNFSGQTLVEAEFSNENLEAADFSDADLRGAVFNGSSLADADFSGVDFTYGIAYLVNFRGADLSDAVLTEAMMLRSKFDGATITGADFSDAILDRDQIVKLCDRASGVNSKTGVATRDSLGCR